MDKHLQIFRIAVLLSLTGLTSAHVASSQPSLDPLTAGRTFVVAFPDTTRNTYDARYPNTRYEDKALLILYSAVDTRVTIRGTGGYFVDTAIAAGTSRVIDLMASSRRAPAPIVATPCRPVDNTFRIEARDPIVMYQVMVTKFGTEAWTPMPVDAWGNEFFAATRQGEVGSDILPGGEIDYSIRRISFAAEILVIAAFDNTEIVINPRGVVNNSCGTSITLNAGQAYLIHSMVYTLSAFDDGDQPNFAGSKINSSKPIGVITGNTRTQIVDQFIGLGRNSFRNMLIEWLAPTALHGTEFVYMPTWDDRRPTGAPSENPEERRKSEMVQVYATTPGDMRVFVTDASGTSNTDGNTYAAGAFDDIRFTPNNARYIRTDLPAQAMMSSAAVVKYAGTTTGGGGSVYLGAAYDSWGGYMVELTPRHRWASFAPFFAPAHPASMEFFINAVVDTAHRFDVFQRNGSPFIFSRLIPGTDLVWGSMAVTPGEDNWLEGRNGARFAGFVYAALSNGGHEEYRPGFTGSPAEYEEYLAIAWGYPLVSRFGITSTVPVVEMSSVSNYITNEPNPFNRTTEIRFAIAKAAHTTIVVYDALGERVRTLVNEYRVAGEYSTTLDASGLASGNYHCRISSGDWSQTRTIIVR